jgi:RNA polymerase sigma-70 factor, ECF subfamily
MKNPRNQLLDEMLVMRCQDGSDRAMQILARRWQRRLWRYAMRLTGRDETAWDVTQEAWMAIIKGLRRLQDPAMFASWALRIVRNKSADHWRRVGQRRRLTEGAAEQQTDSERSECYDRSEALRRALRRLSVDRRELLSLRYEQDLGICAIARILGIPPGTVKSRLHHAREELKHKLEGEQP